MRTVILSAASPELPALTTLEQLVRAELRRKGEADDLVAFALADTKLAYCQGEFDCWVKTPGQCRAHDAEQAIVQAIHDADQVIWIDAITDGGPSYTLKRALDRLICLLSPFFEKRLALTHHGSRYDRQASVFALGWLPAPDAAQARTWADLADANAINLLAPRVGVAVVDDAHPETWGVEIAAMLASRARPGAAIAARAPLRAALIEAMAPDVPPPPVEPPRHAALLVGSAKVRGTSASEVLARACASRLEAAGTIAEVHFVTELLHAGRNPAALRAIAGADLLVLATPLYVDAFPALVVHAFDELARARAGGAFGRLALIVNCGFPEPEHTRTAVRIARHFAARAAYHWMGALAFGGGGAIRPDTPLDDQHGPATHVRRALDAALPALARGEPIPDGARDLAITAPMPDAVYRVIGDLGWRAQAHEHGLHQRDLRARPLD